MEALNEIREAMRLRGTSFPHSSFCWHQAVKFRYLAFQGIEVLSLKTRIWDC